MSLGYDKPLYMLAFDHRASFSKNLLGIAGAPTEAQAKRIADKKLVIYNAFETAIAGGVEPETAGLLVDEAFGAVVARRARDAGYLLAMPVEKSGQDEFDCEFWDNFVDRMNGELVELLTGRSDGERVLQELEDAGAFVVSIDVGRSWFRYHHLLADLLRLELRRTAQHEIPELHEKAAHWYGENGFVLEGIRHAQAGGDWEYAIELLVANWITIGLEGDHATVRSILNAFPPELMRSEPELAVITAVERIITGRWKDADDYVALAEELAGDLDGPRRKRFDLITTIVKLSHARRRGDYDAVVDGAQAILSAEETSVDVASNDDLRLLAVANLGIVELWSLRLQDAERHLLEALAVARTLGRAYLAVACLGHLACLGQLRGRLETAKRLAQEAIDLAEGQGWSDDPIVGTAYTMLGETLVDQGRTEEGARWLEQARHVLQGGSEPATSFALQWALAMVHVKEGRYHDAIRCYREAERIHEPFRAHGFLVSSARAWRARALLWLGELHQVRSELASARRQTRTETQWSNVRASLHLAQGDPDGALQALAPVFDGSAETIHPNLEIEALLIAAIARDRLGDAAAAQREIEQALDLAEPNRRIWIMSVVPVRELLERHPRHLTRHASFLAEILDGFGSAQRRESPDRRLSDRELSVLRYLPTNLSAPEIASELFLSVHTVKTHMRHIYAKLEAHRRKEAVEQARALGLLAPPVSRPDRRSL